jgi:phenylacetate-CoA ligase
VNLRQAAYFALYGLRGQPLGPVYKRLLRETEEGIPPDTTRESLVRLLEHCRRSVPYYREVMGGLGDSFRDDPVEYLRRFPILTKAIIRRRFDDLKSDDLSGRKWYFNTSGGSTGEPVRFIQDWEYATRAGAIKLLFSKLVGKELGESEMQLWGAIRDIDGGQVKWKTRLLDQLARTTLLSVFRMTPGQMRGHIERLNAKRPRLIVAYAEALYELAKFAEREGLEVLPQNAIITSASTLYPFMREKIEKVFRCRVFNRYGSREVGDVACERPGFQGLWIPPWAHYVEIVDDEGNRLPEGAPGEIAVTSLANFAMPLVRYRIEDRGILAPAKAAGEKWPGQVFQEVLGKSYDLFVNEQGVVVEAAHFMPLLYFRDWILRYQVVQKSPSHIVFRIVKGESEPKPGEFEEIQAKTKLIMGSDCRATFEFTDEIGPSPSGKYRFLISEVHR